MSTAGEQLPEVLRDVAVLLESVTPEHYSRPTPCEEMDVAGLREHIVTWSTYFAAALNDPGGTGERPDPMTPSAPADPKEAADSVRAAADGIERAVADGAADRPTKFVQGTMPGQALLSMGTWEYVVHGHDLAVAVGAPWDPEPAAIATGLEFGPSMLKDEYRGPGKSFAYAVDVPDDAPPLDKLLGFSGRDPGWKP